MSERLLSGNLLCQRQRLAACNEYRHAKLTRATQRLAIALGCKPSCTVHITDQSSMLALMQRNTALNGLQDRAKPGVYEWGEPTPPNVPETPDIILAADCVYFEPAFPLLQQTLRDLVGPRTVCYFCFKKRRRADLQFMKVVRREFEVRGVEDDPDGEGYERENVFL